MKTLNRFAKGVWPAALLVLSLNSALAAPALGRAAEILESSIGRFLVTETTAGRRLETLLADAAKRELFEPGLVRIEGEFNARFPGVAVRGELQVAERAYLRLLSERYLIAEGKGFEDTRRMFLDATIVPTQVHGAMPAPLRFPHGVNPYAHPDWNISYGFESEYTLKDLGKLVDFYGPAPEFGFTADGWRSLPAHDRVEWVKNHLRELFPNDRIPGGLVLLNREPQFAFLPPRAILDSTGNIELVLKPVSTFEQWQANISLLNEALGTGSMQGTVGLRSEQFLSDLANNLGFFNFHADLDTLQKLEVGALRYAKSPGAPAASSFNHPFLGPMTQLKQGKLATYLEANAEGRLLDRESLAFVSAQDDSFKYFGGTAYRPDIVPGLTILEVRDAHTNFEALLERMSRVSIYLEHGRAAFAPAARWKAFDSVEDFARLPEPVRGMLERVFPAKLKPGVEYNDNERLALQVYRNFAYPMRPWTTALRSMGQGAQAARVFQAQRQYVERLRAVALELNIGRLSVADAALKIQGAVAQFAVDSQLARIYKEWARSTLRETISAAGALEAAG